MSLKDDLAIFDPAEEVQKAYDQSGKTVFRSESLRPLTIGRISVALSLGCRLLSAAGPEIQKYLQTGIYPNVFRDVIISLWLCSLPDEEIIEIDCRIDVKACLTRAYAWAESIGLRYGSKAYLEGLRIMDEAVTEILSGFFEIDQEDRQEPKKKATGQHGRFASEGRPPGPADILPSTLSTECPSPAQSNGKPSTINLSACD